MRRIDALVLLSECTGDDIWSVEHCRLRRVPEAWIEEMVDGFESGFDTDLNTIYVGDRLVNQYEGIHDIDLAVRIGEQLGVEVRSLVARASSRRELVRLIQDAIEEG
ncbi:MAG: hypothetical protein Aurels2KO_15440 [Aureliella sp.]